MWFPDTPNGNWHAALKHLRCTSPRMRDLIDHTGPCTLAPRKDYFVVLCKAIYAQQLSTTVAGVLFGRFRDQFPARRPTPQRTLALIDGDLEILRRCGLSRQKQSYVKDLATHFATNQIPTRRLAAMSDERVIETLVKVKGIGRWTAEMFLIFTLNRPTSFPWTTWGYARGCRSSSASARFPKRARS